MTSITIPIAKRITSKIKQLLDPGLWVGWKGVRTRVRSEGIYYDSSITLLSGCRFKILCVVAGNPAYPKQRKFQLPHDWKDYDAVLVFHDVVKSTQSGTKSEIKTNGNDNNLHYIRYIDSRTTLTEIARYENGTDYAEVTDRASDLINLRIRKHLGAVA